MTKKNHLEKVGELDEKFAKLAKSSAKLLKSTESRRDPGAGVGCVDVANSLDVYVVSVKYGFHTIGHAQGILTSAHGPTAERPPLSIIILCAASPLS